MAQYQQKTLIEKIFDLGVYSLTAVEHNNFPKSQKYRLCQTILNRIDKIRELAIKCMKKYMAKSTLRDLDTTIEQLRWDIRTSYRLKYISAPKIDIWMEQVNEIGRMVGGWIKKQQESGTDWMPPEEEVGKTFNSKNDLTQE